MTLQRGRTLAWLLIVASIVALFPIQSAINAYRNTFRVVLYPSAEERHVRAVEAAMEGMGLEPQITSQTEDGETLPVVEASVPRRDWGRDLQSYTAAVQNLPRIKSIIPGMNEQGIPLDRIQELNVQDVSIVVIAALIGGFRKSAANVLWLQNESNWHGGRHYRTLPLARMVTTLDPTFTDAWTLTCWHLAYNMSVEAADPEEAADLIGQGIAFAESGLPWNSTRYDLYFEIGWTYYDKLQNYAMAAEYFKRATQFPHPPFLERLIAHSYERIPDIPSALFWYETSLKKYGADPVAQGAIITINERYVPAWEAFAEGDYDEALRRLKRDWQKDDPYDTIGMHFQARIHEEMAEQARRNGDLEQTETLYRRAFETWKASAEHNATDRLARRRVLTIARNWNWTDEVPKGMNDVGVPESWADPTVGRGDRFGTDLDQGHSADDGHGHEGHNH